MILLAMLTLLGIATASDANANADRWSYEYNGQQYDSLGAAEAAMRSNPDYLEVWRTGGASPANNFNYPRSPLDRYALEYRAIIGYYLANETGLNTFGAGGTPKGSPVLPSVGEVASYMVSHSTEVCNNAPRFSPNVFSVSIDGAYSPGGKCCSHLLYKQ